MNTKIYAHQAIIALKSLCFANLFKEKKSSKSPKENEKIVIDFGGQVQYEAFRKIIDFIYLDDLNILDFVNDSTEMIEIIKLAKFYRLENLLRACEFHFKELMIQSFDCSNFVTMKNSSVNIPKTRKPNKEE